MDILRDDAVRPNLMDLGSQCLLYVLSFLPSKDCGRCCTVSQAMNQVLTDDLLWKVLLLRDYAHEQPLGPDLEHQLLTSYRRAYGQWAALFHGEEAPPDMIRRAVAAWRNIESFLAKNIPKALKTLRPGATLAAIEDAEQALGIKMPASLRVIYRVHDGQDLLFDQLQDRRFMKGCRSEGNQIDSSSGQGEVAEDVEEDVDEDGLSARARESITLGVFGGYEFYEHLVSTRMLPLSRIKLWTLLLRMPSLRNMWLFGASFGFEKLMFVSSTNSHIYVSGNRPPAIPLLATPEGGTNDDSVLNWLEEYGRRLHEGWYMAAEPLSPHLPWSIGINLFPRCPGHMASQITRGVKVTVSTLCIPEMSSGEYLFSYSVRFKLLNPDEQVAAWPASSISPVKVITSCQLMTRHWIIRDADLGVVGEVRGEAVVGKFPLLTLKEPDFVYQSCTNLKNGPRGFMEGSFRFVEGSIREPTGAQWEVECPRFTLEVSQFMY
ncbi:hypothetical protein CEUSTIGMA_g8507.t1 [Chlamydomonas eustigma]|uniref:ApaG domain-containing protein n=1 Tax=Chlamydomonas eustigma TaxID=1157962 RepID=A0A250XDU9_9CHLO|nr:hypothetical protein CEUSTIGMA_g8507.t1 [Chlamydomonas eustigma]|eukprot:GAX81072.1 hypothetical protein CEUSTIGMA_g8507.t1 [Chlamydomonas eustigma]